MMTDIIWLKRMLVHNVRMPMSIIKGYGDLLRQGLLSETEKKEAIQNICDNITYMDEVLRVLLDEERELQEAMEKVNIAEVLQQTAKYVSEVARKIPLKISLRVEEPQMFIHGELIAVMRLFYHLFENAVKYLSRGDTISVHAYAVKDEQVLIVFKDNGKGMAEEEVKHIFEKGFRGSNSKGKPGSGYGLYDVKQIVEHSGGTVEVSSRPGMGFSVFLMFPAYREENAERM